MSRVWPAVVLAVTAAPAAAQVIDDDPEIREFVLENSAGTRLRFINYGAIITSIEVPDREGRRANGAGAFPRAGRP